jgi:hypothetical protein
LWIDFNNVLTNLCALYYANVAGNINIYENSLLSMDTANALETQLRRNGFTGTTDIRDNSGTGQVFCDIDNDASFLPSLFLLLLSD